MPGRVYYLRAMVRMADRDVLVKAGLLRASPRTNNVCSIDHIIRLFLTLENKYMLHTKNKIVQGLTIKLRFFKTLATEWPLMEEINRINITVCSNILTYL